MLNLQSECARLVKLNLFVVTFKRIVDIFKMVQLFVSFVCEYQFVDLAHKYLLLEICLT